MYLLAFLLVFAQAETKGRCITIKSVLPGKPTNYLNIFDIHTAHIGRNYEKRKTNTTIISNFENKINSNLITSSRRLCNHLGLYVWLCMCV